MQSVVEVELVQRERTCVVRDCPELSSALPQDMMFREVAQCRLMSSADNGTALVNQYRARIDGRKRQRFAARHASLSFHHGTRATAIAID